MKQQVIVGSKNPVKVKAIERAFASVFSNQSFFVEGVVAPSGVADQPIGDRETLEGAKNRAVFTKKKHPEADFWVGIEGGVAQEMGEMSVFAWIYIVAKGTSEAGYAKTATFFLPQKVTELVNQGMELGDADDKVFGKQNSKQGLGSVGILTHGLIDRALYYEHASILALIPFTNTELYLKEI